MTPETQTILTTIRTEIEQAADVMLSAAEKGLRDLRAVRAGDATALDKVEQTLCAIMEACAFQDLTGQRLTKLEGLIIHVSGGAADGDPLLNGPALPGQGLSQSAADAIMGVALRSP